MTTPSVGWGVGTRRPARYSGSISRSSVPPSAESPSCSDGRRVLGADGQAATGDHVAGVHARVHAHQAHPGLRVARAPAPTGWAPRRESAAAGWRARSRSRGWAPPAPPEGGSSRRPSPPPRPASARAAPRRRAACAASAAGGRSVPRASASSFTGEYDTACPRPRGLSGCVTTARTSPSSQHARRLSTAKVGVPMKTMRGGGLMGARYPTPPRVLAGEHGSGRAY